MYLESEMEENKCQSLYSSGGEWAGSFLTKGSQVTGFVKTSSELKIPKALTSEQKVQLNRKGNEFFNNQEYGKAQQVFIATGYSDGLSRMGDYYMEQNDQLEALRMYYLAKMPLKYDVLAERVAGTVRSLISEGDNKVYE